MNNLSETTKKYFILFALIFFLLSEVLFADTFYCVKENTSPSLKWTAFKYASKTGVSGTFKEIESNIPNGKNSISDIIKNSSFSINISSVDSSNPVRDNTLRTKFFDLFKESKIFGNVESVNEKDKTFVLKIHMNGVEVPVSFKYNLSEGLKLTGTGKTDMLNFKLNKAYASIHKACETLHTGADGISKTWSDLELEVSFHLTKNC